MPRRRPILKNTLNGPNCLAWPELPAALSIEVDSWRALPFGERRALKYLMYVVLRGTTIWGTPLGAVGPPLQRRTHRHKTRKRPSSVEWRFSCRTAGLQIPVGSRQFL